MEAHGLGHAVEKQIRQLSKGMAQTVQLLGTLVHRPRLVVLDEPFSGLDAINQGKLERMIRVLADDGVTVIFSTHVIHHAERLCEGVAIIAGGQVPYAGSVDEARDRIPAQVKLETRAGEGLGGKPCQGMRGTSTSLGRPAKTAISGISHSPKPGSKPCCAP